MSNYSRNQQGRTRGSNQDWNQRSTRRGEDLGGEDNYFYGDDYRPRRRTTFPEPFAGEHRGEQSPQWDRTRHDQREDRSNDGRGGYAGNTYDQEGYSQGNWDRHPERTTRRGRMGFQSNFDTQDYDRGSNRDYLRGAEYSDYLQGGAHSGGRGGWENESSQTWPQSNEMRSAQRTGLHRGKGPRGYQRSDERIREDINDRLSDDEFIDASDIDVIVESCEVTLSGSVDSREAKRRAEDIVEAISGVKNVENRIRVKQGERAGSDGSSEKRPNGSPRKESAKM